MDIVLSVIHQIAAYAETHGWSTLVALAAMSLLTGVAAALHDGTFAWRKMGDICQKVAPMIITFAAVDFFSGSEALSSAVLIIIVASFGASITKNIVAVFPQLEDALPASLWR